MHLFISNPPSLRNANMTEPNKAQPHAEVLMLLATHCPHCPAVLASLSELVKSGAIAGLRVVNIDQQPDIARELGVRSVPWVRIGPFELTGLRSKQELQQWLDRAGTLEGMSAWFEELLAEGGVARVLAVVGQQHDLLAALAFIVADPDAKLNARLGAGAVLEDFEGTDALKALVPRLAELTRHEDARVRSDACHYLSLTHDERARPVIERLLEDADSEVREVAAESLAEL